MSGLVVWKHSDSRGIATAMSQGLARAQTTQWAADATGRADFRGLVLAALMSAADLGDQPPAPAPAPKAFSEEAPATTEGVSVVPQARNTAREDFAEWQTALLSGAFVLLTGGRDPRKAAPIPDGAKFSLTTVDGDPPVASQEAAFGPAVAFAIVGVVAIAGAVVWQYFSQEHELEYVRITTDANVKKHAQSLGGAVNVVTEHLKRERDMGQTVPWSEQETTTLQQLLASTKSLSDWSAPPLKTTPDTRAVTRATAKAIEDVGKGARQAANWMPLVLAAIGIVWVLK